MRREWIIDVLADLKAFAEHNGMDATAASLEDAALVAIAEISSHADPRAMVEARVSRPEDRQLGANVTELFSRRGQM